MTDIALRNRRPILTLVLLLIALALTGGGGWLILLGGSAYYVAAGLAVAGSAWLVMKGDRRGPWLYGAMVVATGLWSLAEVGLDAWGLQARLLAPLVLGVWVFWPILMRLPKWLPITGAVLIAVAAGTLLYLGARIETPAGNDRVIASGGTDWRHYGNSLAGTRFSGAAAITPANASQLERVWTYRTGAKNPGLGFEATPLMVGGSLYLCTPDHVVVSLDPDTGRRLWQFDPGGVVPPTTHCRGVGYYQVPEATGPCARRILSTTGDARLLALDARSGRPCAGFGDKGAVDLKPGMGDVRNGYYYVSSAPEVIAGNIIVGGWVLDGQYVGEPSGVVRAYDARTGKLAWAWDMGRPDERGLPPPGQTYSRGTPNSWAPISGDEELGLIYLPMGNSTPDYWGAHRSAASERYASSVVALDARIGTVRWSFQTVHHDLWDYDVPAQPTLLDLPVAGRIVPALLQPTKRGELFLLDRRTGKPLAPVEERKVAQGAAPGDWTSPTQPFSTGMPTLGHMALNERTMWGATPLDQLWCRVKFRQARYDGPMTPPGLKPTITYPGYLGGMNWGGVSVDPERHIAVVNWNRVANYTRLVPRADAARIKPSISGGAHAGDPVPQIGTPFALLTEAFLSPLGIPCTEPPFGMIGAIDLTQRKMLWQQPLGSAADSGPFGYRSRLPLWMGVPNQGGSLVTRSGLIFIAASQNRAIWAFELTTGRKLWEARLPVGGHATPMTYVSPKSGRQFIVIAVGGNASLRSGSGDYVIGFALPDSMGVRGGRLIQRH